VLTAFARAKQFLAMFRPDVEPAPFDVLSLDGGTDEQAVSDQSAPIAWSQSVDR
jgi:hypothetical protein